MTFCSHASNGLLMKLSHVEGESVRVNEQINENLLIKTTSMTSFRTIRSRDGRGGAVTV